MDLKILTFNVLLFQLFLEEICTALATLHIYWINQILLKVCQVHRQIKKKGKSFIVA